MQVLPRYFVHSVSRGLEQEWANQVLAGAGVRLCGRSASPPPGDHTAMQAHAPITSETRVRVTARLHHLIIVGTARDAAVRHPRSGRSLERGGPGRNSLKTRGFWQIRVCLVILSTPGSLPRGYSLLTGFSPPPLRTKYGMGRGTSARQSPHLVAPCRFW